MARDVEIKVTADDETGAGLSSVERRMAAAQRKIEKDNDRIAKSFGKSASAVAETGGTIGMLFGQRFAAGLSKAAPAAGPVLVGVAIASAPLIGATMAAAVIGGSAGLGIVGGAMLAAKDPRVAAAWSATGDTISDRLKDQSRAFIRPAIDGAALVSRRFNESAGDVQRLFDSSSRYVRPLLEGATRGIQRVVSAVSLLSSKAGPVVDSLSQGIADTLDAVADGMEKLADNGAEAGTALRQTFQLIEVSVRGVFNTINLLTEAYGVLAKLGAFGRDAQQQMFILEANAKLAADGVGQVGAAASAAAPPAEAYADRLAKVEESARGVVDAQRELYGSTTEVAAALAETSKSIRDNGRTLDLNSAKGRANREQLTRLAGTLQSNYDAYRKVNGESAATVARGEQLRNSFVKTARSAGLSSAAANRLADDILGIPASRTTRARLDHQAALAAARRVRAAVRAIPTQWRSAVTIAASVTGSPASRSALSAALNKQSLKFAPSSDYWSAADMNTAGRARTGGAEPVTVNTTVEQALSVSLDGTPFYAFTAAATAAARRRDRWHARVGGKFS